MHLVIPLRKGGPFIGPHGGKWADAAHTIPWKPAKVRKPYVTNNTTPTKKQTAACVAIVRDGKVFPDDHPIWDELLAKELASQDANGKLALNENGLYEAKSAMDLEPTKKALVFSNDLFKAAQFKYRMSGWKRFDYASAEEWAKIVGDPVRFAKVVEWHPPKGYGTGEAAKRKAEKFIAEKVNRARAGARNASGVTSDKPSPHDAPLRVAGDPLPVVPLDAKELPGIKVIQDRVANWSKKRQGFKDIGNATATGLPEVGIDPTTHPMAYLLSVGWHRQTTKENPKGFGDLKVNTFTPKEMGALHAEFAGVIGRVAFSKKQKRAIAQTTLEPEDLEQVGYESLMDAAKKFTPDKGNFTAYAIGAIENGIRATARRARRDVVASGDDLIFHEDFDGPGQRVVPPRMLSPEQVTVMHRQAAYLMENIRAPLSKEEYGVLSLYWDLGHSAIFNEEVDSFGHEPRMKEHSGMSARLGTKRTYTFRTMEDVAALMHQNGFEGYGGDAGRKKAAAQYDDAVTKIVDLFDATDVTILREFAFTQQQLSSGNWRMPVHAEASTELTTSSGKEHEVPAKGKPLITGKNRAWWVTHLSTPSSGRGGKFRKVTDKDMDRILAGKGKRRKK